MEYCHTRADGSPLSTGNAGRSSGRIPLSFTLYGDLVHRRRARRRRLALDRRSHRANGTLWRFGGCRAAGGFASVAARVASGAARGNRAFYSVTARGRRRIAELSPRIYGPVIDWDGRWRVLIYARPARPARCAIAYARSCGCSGGPRFRRRRGSRRAIPSRRLARGRGQRPHRQRALSSKQGIAARCSDRQFVERCWNLERNRGAHTALSSIATGPRLAGERERRRTRRRSGVRRAALARARLPQVRLPRPGSAERTRSRTLAGNDRGGPLSRILRGTRPEVAALLPEQSRRRVTERDPAASKRPGHAQKRHDSLCRGDCLALAVPACNSNNTTVDAVAVGFADAEPIDHRRNHHRDAAADARSQYSGSGIDAEIVGESAPGYAFRQRSKPSKRDRRSSRSQTESNLLLGRVPGSESDFVDVRRWELWASLGNIKQLTLGTSVTCWRN